MADRDDLSHYMEATGRMRRRAEVAERERERDLALAALRDIRYGDYANAPARAMAERAIADVQRDRPIPASTPPSHSEGGAG